MKNVTFIRHAKSSWDHADLSDRERPLNKRGKHDAPLMGKILLKKLKPDLFISSPAKRAFSTASRIAAAFEYNKDSIIKEERLYMAHVSDFLEVIREIAPDHSDVFLFSHNPGITEAVNYLSGSTIDNIPTCGVALIQFDVNNWKDVSFDEGELLFFDFPKKHY